MSQIPSPLVVITGMHRSGTSLTASFLTVLGIHLGERLLAADPLNPLGYFEDVDFVELHARMLEAATRQGDGGHRDWGWTESESFDCTGFPALAEAARSLVAARADRPGLWGWKDPRTTLLLDFWDEILEERAVYVFLYRFPWEVADSIQRVGANEFLENPEYAFRIWAFYNRRLLDFYRRHADRAVLVSANAFQCDPALFVGLLRDKLGLAVGDAPLETVWQPALFASFDPEDPLIRLTAATSPECTELLAELDACADLPAAGLWSASPLKGERLRPPGPIDLSVVIPCYNHGQFLVDAIASVERTLPERCELVVVNDGSTQPRTLEILEVLRQTGYPILDQPNAGLAAARNNGVRAARGRYVLPLDADNRLVPGFVKSAVAVLNAESEVGVVYGDRLELGVRSGRLRIREFDIAALLWTNYIDACAVYRREIWRACGGYDARASVWEDWELWIAAAKRGWRFHHLPEVTFEYRVRPNSMLAVAERKGLLPSVREYVFRKHQAFYLEHINEVLIAGHTPLLVESVRDAGRPGSDIDVLGDGKRTSSAPENIVQLEVFHPAEEGYRSTESQARYFANRSWQFLTVGLPARNAKSGWPIRIDPAACPAVIEIKQIALKRPGADDTVWSAATPAEFDEFEIAGTASRLPHDKHLQMLSFGNDPQLVFPLSTIKFNDEPLRLELTLLVDSHEDTIRTCLAALRDARSDSSSS